MAKAVAKSKKTVEKIVAKSKPSKAAPAASARKALTKSPAKPVASTPESEGDEHRERTKTGEVPIVPPSRPR